MTSFLQNSFKKTVRNISRTVLVQSGEKNPVVFLEGNTDFIINMWQKMPLVYKFGLVFLAYCFNAVPLLSQGKTFNNLPSNEQENLVTCWLNSSRAIKKKFIRFFLNLTLMALYDSPSTFKAAGADWGAYLRIQNFYNSGTDNG